MHVSRLRLILCPVIFLFISLDLPAATGYSAEDRTISGQTSAIPAVKGNVLSVKNIESKLGRRMTFLEKLSFKLNRKKIEKFNAGRAPAETTNSWAIAAFVCGILLPPLGIVFGFIALNDIKKKGERGRGLALAGIIIGIAFMLWSSIALFGGFS